jgi:predicted phage terminase large subunit-like protein
LYNLAYQLKRFVLLIGEGGGVAKSNLATLVTELEENDQLLEDFPHLAAKRDAKNQLEKWTDEQIVIANGATVWAKGMGARMRGLKRGASRPDLAIVDDPESPETSASFVTRIRHRKWFGGTFLGLGSKGWDVYVISNLPHHDCLVAHLLRSQEWDGKLYRAINLPRREDERYPIGNTKTDGTALWPAVWPLSRLQKYRQDPTVGELGFAREMMGDPRDEKDKPFNTKEFTQFEWLGPVQLKEYSEFAIFIDPTGGEKPGELKKGRKDWAAIVFAGRHKNGFIDVIDVRLTRKLPDRQYELVLDVYEAWLSQGCPRIVIGAEENIAKNLIGPELLRRARERSLYPQVIEQHQVHNKVQRILGMQPQVASGVVRWRKDLFVTQMDYFGQFDDFPGDHEDGPDATEAVLRLLEKRMFVGVPSGIEKVSHFRGRV